MKNLKAIAFCTSAVVAGLACTALETMYEHAKHNELAANCRVDNSTQQCNELTLQAKTISYSFNGVEQRPLLAVSQLTSSN